MINPIKLEPPDMTQRGLESEKLYNWIIYGDEAKFYEEQRKEQENIKNNARENI